MEKQDRSGEIKDLRERLLTEDNPNKQIVILLVIMAIESDMASNLAKATRDNRLAEEKKL